jgi:iron uptake system component EfeO
MRRAYLVAAAAALPLLLAACGGGSDSSSGTDTSASGGGTAKVKPNEVSVKIVEAGCDPAQLDLPAGPTTFKVLNDGAAKISEFEVLDGDRILGEVENIAPGLSGEFYLTLRAGTYTTYCPGGDSQERGTLEVTGELSPGVDEGANSAVAAYRT